MAINIKNATEFDRNIKMLSYDRKGYINRLKVNYQYDDINTCSYYRASIGPVEPHCSHKTIFEPHCHRRFMISSAQSKSDRSASTIKRISIRLEENNKPDSKYYVIYRKGKFIKIRR